MSMKPGVTTLPAASISVLRLGHLADGDDAPVADADVGSRGLGAGAVDDEAVADREVDAHRRRPQLARSPRRRRRPSAITTP